MCHQVLQLGWSIFFNPWYLDRLIIAYDNLWTFCAMCTVFWTDRVGRLSRLGDGSVVHCSVVHDVVLRFGMYVISQLRFAGKFFHGKLPRIAARSGEEAIKLYVRAADLGCSQAHFKLGDIYHEGGDMKKAKFHFPPSS